MGYAKKLTIETIKKLTFNSLYGIHISNILAGFLAYKLSIPFMGYFGKPKESNNA